MVYCVVGGRKDGFSVLIGEVCKKDGGRRSSLGWRGRQVSGAGGRRSRKSFGGDDE